MISIEGSDGGVALVSWVRHNDLYNLGSNSRRCPKNAIQQLTISMRQMQSLAPFIM
jgi:hypothetical protein